MCGAAVADHGPVGSRKSEALARRYVALLRATGAAPSDTIVASATPAGAADLAARIAQLLEPLEREAFAHAPFAGTTLDAPAFAIVAEGALAAGLAPDLEWLEPYEAAEIFERAAAPLFSAEWADYLGADIDPEISGLRAPDRFAAAVLRLIVKLRDAGIGPEAMLSQALRAATTFYAQAAQPRRTRLAVGDEGRLPRLAAGRRHRARAAAAARDRLGQDRCQALSFLSRRAGAQRLFGARPTRWPRARASSPKRRSLAAAYASACASRSSTTSTICRSASCGCCKRSSARKLERVSFAGTLDRRSAPSPALRAGGDLRARRDDGRARRRAPRRPPRPEVLALPRPRRRDPHSRDAHRGPAWRPERRPRVSRSSIAAHVASGSTRKRCSLATSRSRCTVTSTCCTAPTSATPWPCCGRPSTPTGTSGCCARCSCPSSASTMPRSPRLCGEPASPQRCFFDLPAAPSVGERRWDRRRDVRWERTCCAASAMPTSVRRARERVVVFRGRRARWAADARAAGIAAGPGAAHRRRPLCRPAGRDARVVRAPGRFAGRAVGALGALRAAPCPMLRSRTPWPCSSGSLTPRAGRRSPNPSAAASSSAL